LVFPFLLPAGQLLGVVCLIGEPGYGAQFRVRKHQSEVVMSMILAHVGKARFVIVGAFLVAGAIAGSGFQVCVGDSGGNHAVVMADGGHNWLSDPTP
jgi:hypothetical protein